VLQPGTILQVIGAMAIASIFTCAHIKCQPFEKDLDDNLQSCSLVSTVFTLWAAALLMSPPPHHPLVGPFMVMVNVAVFLLAIYTLVMDTIPSAIDKYKQKFADAQAALALVQAKMAEREEKQRKNERIRQEQNELSQENNKEAQDDKNSRVALCVEEVLGSDDKNDGAVDRRKGKREGKGEKSRGAGGKKKKRAEEEEDQRNQKEDTRGQQEDKRAHIFADYFSRYGTITVTATASSLHHHCTIIARSRWQRFAE